MVRASRLCPPFDFVFTLYDRKSVVKVTHFLKNLFFIITDMNEKVKYLNSTHKRDIKKLTS